MATPSYADDDLLPVRSLPPKPPIDDEERDGLINLRGTSSRPSSFSSPLRRCTNGKSRGLWWKAGLPFIALSAIVVGVSVLVVDHYRYGNVDEFLRDDYHIPKDMQQYEESHPFVDVKEENRTTFENMLVQEDEEAMNFLTNESPDAIFGLDADAQEERDYQRRFLEDTPITYHNSICPQAEFLGNCIPLNTGFQNLFEIPCGVCYVVSITNGATLNFPGGIHIKGKLVIPSSANVVIRTTHIFVFGFFQIAPPVAGNKVKVEMYGAQLHTYTAPTAGEKCGDGCDMGTKAIVVLGGKVDIRGMADPTCPAWEKLTNVGSGDTKPVSLDCGGTECPRITIAGACTESQGHTAHVGKLVMSCPVMSAATIKGGDSTPMIFKAINKTPWAPPTSAQGEPMTLAVGSIATVDVSRSTATGRCLLRLPLEQTVHVPNHEPRTRYTFTSAAAPFQMPSVNGVSMSLTITGGCIHSAGHSSETRYIVFCPIADTVTVPTGSTGPIKFTTQNGLEVTASAGVHHWAWQGRYIFFASDVSVDMVNSLWPAGTTLTVERLNTAPGGETFEVDGIYHWAWQGRTMWFFPESYPEIADCQAAADDFNSKFSVGFGIDVSLPPDLAALATRDEVRASGVHHWAWPVGAGHRMYMYPDSTVAEFNAIFTPGTEIEATYDGVLEYKQIEVTRKFAECLEVGGELLLTSTTRNFRDRQLVTIASIDLGSNLITLTEGIEKPLTLADHPDFAIEVASMSRRVTFTSERDASYHGGHFMIHNTAATQHIEGIEILGFGQQAMLGRYPIHFHFCGDSVGSEVNKNVVRESTQRGYVIHHTNDVKLNDNVAFDVVGHCYFLEKGSEMRNEFRHNIGADVKVMPAGSVSVLGAKSGRVETDDQPSIYWISNPYNDFYGNIAAGGERFGVWFETRGDNVNRNLGAYEDNECHSMQHFAWSSYPPGWRPADIATIKNLKVYRNGSWGLFLHVTQYLNFIGGIIADNARYGVMINRGDAQLFKNTVFWGQTQFAEKLIPQLCSSGRLGIGLHPARLNEFDETGSIWGSKLEGTRFYNFGQDDFGCGGIDSYYGPMQTRTEQVFVHAYSAPHYFNDVYFDKPYTLDGCHVATELQMDDVQMEVVSDAHKAFSPSGLPGFLVSNKVKGILPTGTQCTPYQACPTYPAGALEFCPGVCMRSITIKTDAPKTGNVVMIVVDQADASKSLIIEGKLREGEAGRFPRHFTVALPPGRFFIKFEENGQPVWPQYAKPIFEVPPACTNYVGVDDVSFYQPPPAAGACDIGTDLLVNNRFDRDSSGWGGYLFGDEWSPTAGVGSSGALVTTRRTHYHAHSVNQNLDDTCIAVGNTYEISIAYRVVNNVGNPVSVCQGKMWDCPDAYVIMREFDSYNGSTSTRANRLATTDVSSLAGGFYLMTGSWTVSASDEAADRYDFRISYGLGQLVIDNAFITRIA